MSLKKSTIDFDNINNISLYQDELAKKDIQILILKKKINNLIYNKNSLISQIGKSMKKVVPSLKYISPQNRTPRNTLFSSKHSIQHDNSLRNKIIMNQKIEDKYSNTIQYKLLSAQKEIKNLTIMNTNKDNIIMNMMKFINNLNNIICGGKINLNLNKIDITTFFLNLKQLEYIIFSKLEKINNPNKLSQFVTKKSKNNKIITKQKTEINLSKKKKIFIVPIIRRRNNNNNKINNQSSINRSRISNSNNSLNIQNFSCQYYPKYKIVERKDINNFNGRNKSKGNKKIFKHIKAFKLKKIFLTGKDEKFAMTPPKDISCTLDNNYYDKYNKIMNKEIIANRFTHGNENGQMLNNYNNK